MTGEEAKYYFSTPNYIIKNSYSSHVDSKTFSMHIHSGYEIIYLLGGTITYGFEGKTIKFESGDILVTPPFKYHYIKVEDNSTYERINILFYPEKFGIDLNLDDILIYNDSSHAIYKILNSIMFYCEYASEEDYKFIFDLKIKELIYFFSKDFSKGAEFNLKSNDKTIKKILSYINDNIYSPLTIEDISTNCFLSEGHIHHIFKKQLKTSPLNYIKMKKLSIAQKLLALGNSPTEVAEKLGFEDYSVFYRNYIKFFNKKPSADLKK